MRRLVLAAPMLLALALAAPARASFAHTVMPGETLWSIAAQDGLSSSSLAAFNGIASDTQVVIGQTIEIPPLVQTGTAPSASGATAASGASSPAEPDGDEPEPQTASTVTAASPPPMGGYTVQPGDSLSAIALRAGVPAAQIAAMNGLSVDGPLLSGTVLKLPTGAPQAAGTPGVPTTASTGAGGSAGGSASGSASGATGTVVPAAAPYPTPMRLDSSTIGQIASAQGVPPSLAAAIAWQESGNNNNLVSSANARGIMQIVPGTWQYVQNNLASTTLNPNSATDNVRAGSLYLASLLRATGGNVPSAIASYYQGLGSVRQNGMFADTQRYVADVMALMPQFGG